MFIVGGGVLVVGDVFVVLSECLVVLLFISVVGKGLLLLDVLFNVGVSLCVVLGWEMIVEVDLVLVVGIEMVDIDFWCECLLLFGELICVDIDLCKFNDFYFFVVVFRGDVWQIFEVLLVCLLQEVCDVVLVVVRVVCLCVEICVVYVLLQVLYQVIFDWIVVVLLVDVFVSIDMI